MLVLILIIALSRYLWETSQKKYWINSSRAVIIQIYASDLNAIHNSSLTICSTLKIFRLLWIPIMENVILFKPLVDFILTF